MAEQDQLLKTRMIAILIDGDNAQPSLIKETLVEASKYGRTTIRRIYGDWTTPSMNGWKEALQENAIQPIQQFRNTVGKNATDSAMIIDAMDILHAGVVDGFCLVSSDSDYTRLATRIREKGVFVMGVGRHKTAKSFTNACDLFVFTENLAPQLEKQSPKTTAHHTAHTASLVTKALPLVKLALKQSMRDDGWAQFSAVGSMLRSLDPSFDHRTYGCASLRSLIGQLSEQFETREEATDGGSAVVFVRSR